MTSAPNREATPAAEHRTVSRVMSMLELVLASDRNGMRLGELSASIDAPKSSIHGLAKGLVAAGYFREEKGRYFAGPAISSLIAVSPTALSSVYRHALEQLADRWNETAMLASLVGDSVVYLDRVEPEVFIRAAPPLNRRVPLWPRSSGKCFLAFMEPKKLDAFLRRNRFAPEDTPELRAELGGIRERQVGLNIGQSIAEHIGIASPVVVHGTPVTLAIAVAGPRSRMEDRVEEMAESVVETVRTLSSRP
jgi:DNA-binding IclR family transcriptional regulator